MNNRTFKKILRKYRETEKLDKCYNCGNDLAIVKQKYLFSPNITERRVILLCKHCGMSLFAEEITRKQDKYVIARSISQINIEGILKSGLGLRKVYAEAEESHRQCSCIL